MKYSEENFRQSCELFEIKQSSKSHVSQTARNLAQTYLIKVLYVT